MKKYTTTQTPIGKLYILCSSQQITGLWIEGQAHSPDLSTAEECCNDPTLQEAIKWVQGYFSGAKPEPTALSLAPEGTAFQQAVWKQLLCIPYGETVSYGQIAKAIGNPSAFQAVGNALGRNPISIIIPCHRVLGANRQLIGYAGGLPAKKYLLELEQRTK